MANVEILDRLAAVIGERNRERPEGSYTGELFRAGHAAIAAKLREESEELIEAAAASDAAHTAHEAADLLFHTLVLLEFAGVEPASVYAELERRFGTSGLEEKAGRGRGDRAC